MAVFRVHKTKNYTVMSNFHLRDKRLTLKAKGLLSVILSLPDDWNYSIAGLASICKEGVSAVKSALDELSENGYIRIVKRYPNETDSGRIEYEYDIFESPFEEIQGIENQPLESQSVENRGQLNTKEPITDKRNTDDKSGTAQGKRGKAFVPPSPQQVREYAKEIGLTIDADYFCDYWESVGWMRGKTKMKDWKATARNWARRERKGNGNGASSLPDYGDSW